MMRWIPAYLALSLLLGGCSKPELEGTRWKCSSQPECGDGYLCNISGYCEEALRSKHGVFDDRLVLGMSAAITTGPTGLGGGMKSGIETYFASVNKSGGVHGRKLELLALDDGFDPDKALSNVKELVSGSSHRAFALLGNMEPPSSLAADWVTDSAKVIFFGPLSGVKELRKDPPARYAFNYRASLMQETQALVEYFIQVREPKIAPQNIAAMVEGEPKGEGALDPYGQSGFDGVSDALGRLGGVQAKDIKTATYKRNTMEIEPATGEILKWVADGHHQDINGQIVAAVIMVGTYEPSALFVKEVLDEIDGVKKTGNSRYDLSPAQKDELKKVKEIVFASVSFVGPSEFVEKLNGFSTYGANKKHCDGIIVSQVVPHPESAATGVLAYREGLRAFSPNLAPSFVSLEGYIVAQLFVEGLKAQGRELTTESLVETLDKLKTIDLGIGITLGFSKNQHQASQKVWGSVIKVNADKKCVYEALELKK